MAILRNREVTILDRVDSADMSPVYVVSYTNGVKENAKLTDLRLTKDEYGYMLRQNGDVYMNNVSRIDDKELQDIRDSQDRVKLEAKTKPEFKYTEVSVKSTKK